jgi:hypothetical protein
MDYKRENELIYLITARATLMWQMNGEYLSKDLFASKLKTIHTEICPLQLEAFFKADKEEFRQEVMGIQEYTDLLDASFRNGYKPKFAA